MSPIPSRTLAIRVGGRLRAATLLALLLVAMPLARSPGGYVGVPIARAQVEPPPAIGVTTSMTAAPLGDTNGNGHPDPGETLRYSVVITNSGVYDLAGVAFEDTLDPNTSLIAGSLQISPLAFTEGYSTLRDAPLTINAPGVLANDTGTPAPSVVAGNLATAAGGSVTTSADGGFSYTPPPGYTGIDSFAYSATNSAGSDSGLVILTVRSVPIATDDSYAAVRDTPRTVTAPGLLANDLGFPPPSVTPFTGPTTAGGTVTVVANGGFSYSPPAGYTGDDTFVYTAVNAAGSDTATVTLTVGLGPLAQIDYGDGSAQRAATPVTDHTSRNRTRTNTDERGRSVFNPRSSCSSASCYLESEQLPTPVSATVGVLPADKRVTILFDVTIANPLPIGVGQLVNQGSVAISGFANLLTDDPRKPGAADPTTTFIGTRVRHLPIVMVQAGPPLPDLVVSNIIASGGTFQITIRNDGQLAVFDPFWVDAYINPTTAPVRVNQLWNAVGERGATWGVVGNVLPFTPGETLTLTVGDSYYRPALSNLGGSITAGTRLYAQVDSFSTSCCNGAVLETHERDRGGYNNVLGPVGVTR